MTKTIEFVGTATIMATADGEHRMELVGSPGCALWSTEDVGKRFSVHIAEIEPEPPCPVCGKPASEHRGGLFCCAHCGGEARMMEGGSLYQARCTGAICGIAGLWYSHPDNARAAWNRRA